MKRLVIKNRTVTGFVDEVSLDGLIVENQTITRVSRILPVNPLKSLAFRLLRIISTDKSRIAQWTRDWQGPWQVLIDNNRYGPFNDRGKAIDFEKEKIYKLGKMTLDNTEV